MYRDKPFYRRKQCPVCRRLFWPSHSTHVYDSDECFKENRRRLARERERAMRREHMESSSDDIDRIS